MEAQVVAPHIQRRGRHQRRDAADRAGLPDAEALLRRQPGGVKIRAPVQARRLVREFVAAPHLVGLRQVGRRLRRGMGGGDAGFQRDDAPRPGGGVGKAGLLQHGGHVVAVGRQHRFLAGVVGQVEAALRQAQAALQQVGHVVRGVVQAGGDPQAEQVFAGAPAQVERIDVGAQPRAQEAGQRAGIAQRGDLAQQRLQRRQAARFDAGGVHLRRVVDADAPHGRIGGVLRRRVQRRHARLVVGVQLGVGGPGAGAGGQRGGGAPAVVDVAVEIVAGLAGGVRAGGGQRQQQGGGEWQFHAISLEVMEGTAPAIMPSAARAAAALVAKRRRPVANGLWGRPDVAAVLLYFAAMNAPLPAPSSGLAGFAAAPSWLRGLAAFALNLAMWVALSALGALTSLNDDLRHGVHGSYWLIFVASCKGSTMLAALSFVLYTCFSRWPRLIAGPAGIAACYGLMLLLFLPLQLMFLARLYLQYEDAGAAAAGTDLFGAIDQAASLLRVSSVTAVYIAVVALKIWQQNRARAREAAQARADSLALRLALEQQRGLALRAQLEPHFMFNALGAIVALVRDDDKQVALEGLHSLGDLLRYALNAGEVAWVGFDDELRFVQDYLDLQRLRYGARLQLRITGVDAGLLDCDCPPLLLQPLVENALRHDLDLHEHGSDIHLAFTRADGHVAIAISNRMHAGAAVNPGAGLGLRNIADRLRLAYGAAATIRAGVAGDRFEVQLRMPDHAPA